MSPAIDDKRTAAVAEHASAGRLEPPAQSMRGVILCLTTA
jgi:hypothetical protein